MGGGQGKGFMKGLAKGKAIGKAKGAYWGFMEGLAKGKAIGKGQGQMMMHAEDDDGRLDRHRLVVGHGRPCSNCGWDDANSRLIPDPGDYDTGSRR